MDFANTEAQLGIIENLNSMGYIGHFLQIRQVDTSVQFVIKGYQKKMTERNLIKY